MDYSKKLGPPIISAAVATIVLSGFTTVTLAQREYDSPLSLYHSIWPMILTSTVALILVMSILHRALVELVEELEKREIAAQHQALHDQLSGLPNRTLLEQKLNIALSDRKEDGCDVALLILDLDSFKQINDTLGHAAGDELVQQVADRLTSRLRNVDTIARIGGDEFAMVLVNRKNQLNIDRVCKRILAAVDGVFHLAGKEAHIGVSVGAAIATADDTAAELLRKADITMYRAKAEGRGCYRLFTNQMDVAVQRSVLVQDKLRKALSSASDLDVHYQPQLDVRGKTFGVEALLRWHDSDLGEIAPFESIPIAEESGLIRELGDYVLKHACGAARKFPYLKIAVNLSPAQFRIPNFAIRMKERVQSEGLSCEQFELEITENLFVEYGNHCRKIIDDLRKFGFSVALDDFGTGYSSLSYLRRFQVDTIKLDRSFIKSAGEEKSVAMIRAAVTLGHALNLRVVAEGISSSEQERIAVEAGCDLLQGHLFAPAMLLSDLGRFLQDQTQSFRAA